MQAIKKVFSHDDTTNEHNSSRTSNGQGFHTRQGDTDVVGGAVDNSRTHNNPLSSTSNGTPGGHVGEGHHNPSHGTGARGVGEHIREAAEPPHATHTQPSERTHLDRDAASRAEHDHKHLAAVTQERHQVHETEEVLRQREVDRHVHHVQHHTQPVRDTQHASEVHHENVVPTTKVKEQHVNTHEDKGVLAGLVNKHKDHYEEAPKDRVVVDKGEVVNEKEHHHVHHVVQPVIQRDTHEHHTVHTVVPTHHEVHEAPVLHQSVEHEPMNIKDFVKGGGDIKSKLTHENAGILRDGEGCERQVDGPAEGLLEKLHIKSHHDGAGATAAGANTSNIAGNETRRL